MNKYIRLFNTIKYLKFTQIYFRLFYFIRNKFRKIIGFKYKFSKESSSTHLSLIDSCEYYSSYKNSEFTILNLSKKFDDKINWNYCEYRKLWTYNLTYFEYLKEKEDVSLIYDFIENIESINDGFEPFPISLRGINWIKFLTKYEIKDKKIDDSLYAQYYILLDNLEYHLLGNHLLENGFSLLFGAYYFKDETLYKKAKDILEKELKEQILDDGGHFELSPMYHQLMLFRVLDCINLIKNNSWKNKELLELLEKKASLMLGWLKNISYENGEIPLLNDSTNKIAPTSIDLFNYAKSLSINYKTSTMNQSGYRKITKENYECILDIGEIGASYIPGHAHADTFNFELYIKEKPFIVDTGLSTYNIGKQRNIERSTKAHNTVEINNENSSEVWGGFRVANRANIIELIEKEDLIKATHDGYKKKFSILHTREWKFEEDKIIINDTLNKKCQAIARLHFYPDIIESEILNKINLEKLEYKIQNYDYASEFNKTIKALVLEIRFKKELKLEINI
ncbi:heparinase II/III family protein [Aliarcobacter butzleri]|uniref:alginate lyase family protein n=1 Tax=Aliarcobacter butzleri TaxID=28197 RepID=UPI0021B1EB03|nr:alginate lyase family protein [Aliarcobacter butzleri]UXC30024.1 heparinase II/III family protein [Aliarcobacter butzleri]